MVELALRQCRFVLLKFAVDCVLTGGRSFGALGIGFFQDSCIDVGYNGIGMIVSLCFVDLGIVLIIHVCSINYLWGINYVFFSMYKILYNYYCSLEENGFPLL